MKIKSTIIEIVILVLAFIGTFSILYYAGQDISKGVLINCSIAEISPDFTVQMREACRQAHTKKP